MAMSEPLQFHPHYFELVVPEVTIAELVEHFQKYIEWSDAQVPEEPPFEQ